MEIDITVNELIPKYGKRLQSSEQLGVELEFAKHFLKEFALLMSYPAGTHFKVNFQPIEAEQFNQEYKADPVTGEVTTDNDLGL